jgi:hypothetical protein
MIFVSMFVNKQQKYISAENKLFFFSSALKFLCKNNAHGLERKITEIYCGKEKRVIFCV